MSYILCTNKKIILTFLLFIMGVFVYGKNANATTSTLLFQGVRNQTYNAVGTTPIGQSFTSPFTGTLKSILLPFNRHTGTANCQWVISVPLGVNNDYGTTNISIGTTDQSDPNNWPYFYWTNSPHVTSGLQYYIKPNCTSPENLKYYGSATDVLSGGQAGSSTNRGTTIYNSTGIADLGFTLFADFTVGGIVFAGTPVSLPDFTSWATYATIPTASTSVAFGSALNNYKDGWDRVIRWGNTPALGSADYTNGVGLINPWSNNIEPLFETTKRTKLQPGVYYAQAVLCDQQKNNTIWGRNTDDCAVGHVIASSDIWAFTIVAGATVPSNNFVANPLISATSTDNGANFTCDPNDSFFKSSLCNLFLIFFYPDRDVFDKYSNLKNEILLKPPFGYFTMVSTTLSSIFIASSTTDTQFSTIASSTEMQISTWSSLSIIILLKNIFSWLVWVLFIFYLYKRFKYFSLHG